MRGLGVAALEGLTLLAGESPDDLGLDEGRASSGPVFTSNVFGPGSSTGAGVLQCPMKRGVSY